MLSADLAYRHAYDRDGFVRVSKVFDVADVERFSAEANRMLDERGRGKTWNGPWREDGAVYSLLTVGDVHRHSDVFKAAAHDPRLLKVVEDLIGPCQLVAGMLIVKPPENGQPFPLHQDSAYYSPEETDYCIACVHLDAATSESGALRFLPGIKDNLPHVHAGKAHIDPSTYRMEDTVEVCAKAGDVVAFNIRTPHCSGLNTSQFRRAVVRYGYVPKKAK